MAIRTRARVTAVGLYIPPDPTQNFIYPDHIDHDSLDALPRKPGVYLFRDRHGVPIYIGKSVNIRARVLSHLRTPEEAAMLQAAYSVDFERTAGEIGALLRESQLVKQLQPAYNILLRNVGPTFTIRLPADDMRPHIVSSWDGEDAEGGDSYGLFASHRAAQEGLRALIKHHRLCPALTGFETTTCGRPCFAHQLGQCLGACAGKESHATHRARLQNMLEQLEASVWPYAGPIGIIEESDDMRQIHVVERWSYLGSLRGCRTKFKRPARQSVDIDVYNILARPLRNGELNITLMQS